MQIHHYTLQHLANYMQIHYQDGLVASVFSQTKDELVICFEKDESEFVLRICTSQPLPYVWPVKEFAKARKNVVDLFDELLGKKFISASVVLWDRVLILKFSNEMDVVLKMHGNRSNVLIRKNGKVTSVFRKSIQDDFNFSESPGIYDENGLSNDNPENVAAVIKKVCPIYDALFADRIEAIMDSGVDFPNAFGQCISEAENENFYVELKESKMKFLLVPSSSENSIQVNGIASALDVFLRSWHQYHAYSRQYQEAKQLVVKQDLKIKGNILSYETSIKKLDSARSGEEIGSILMANLHQMKSGMKEIELEDFYLNQPIRIKLNEKLNPQQNAERYFGKQKDRKKQRIHLEELLKNQRVQKESLAPVLSAFEKLCPASEMALLANGLDQIPLREMSHFRKVFHDFLNTDKSSQEVVSVFYEFEKDGYTILVGRNARNNDELTFSFSNKEDMWLHARDVPGSHVIIRKKGQGIPAHVIEYAASLAAFYSKRKKEGIAPVIYTLRKYVRKPKKGLPGQVLVEREKVLLVEPAIMKK